MPSEVWSADLSQWKIDDAVERMEEYGRYLESEPEITTKHVSLQGEIAPTLQRYADSQGADLIAVGSHGRNFAQRALLGSVSAALLAHPTQAVLVTGSGR